MLRPWWSNSLTRADVFLQQHNLVLEYQRWDTDFPTRTAQRQSAGAARTVWMFPWQPPGAPRTHTLKSFDNEVFERGGIYVAVRNKNDRSELQRPWEDASQERTARLYASGSIAVFDPDRGTLIRKELSLATVLAEIIGGDRVLALAVVLKKSNGSKARKWVWALSDDLARAEAAQEERRRATRRAPVAERQPGPPIERKVQSDVDSAAEQHNPPLPVDVQASGTSAELAPNPPAAETANEHCAAPKEAAREALSVNNASRTARPPKNQQPAPRGSWWKSVANWFRRL